MQLGFSWKYDFQKVRASTVMVIFQPDFLDVHCDIVNKIYLLEDLVWNFKVIF